MREPVRKTGAVRERAPLPAVTLFLLLSGVLGLLLLFRSLEGVSFREAAVFPTAVVVCCGLWAAHRRGWLAFWAVFLGVSALLARFVWRSWDALDQSVRTLAARFSGVEGQSADMTALALALAAGLSLLLFLLEFLLHSHETVYTLVTLLLAFSPALGFQLGFAAVFLLCVFRFACRVFQMTRRRGRRSLLSAAAQTRLAGKTGAAMCLLLALSFLAAAPLALLDANVLYSPVYSAEEAVTEYLNRMRPAGLDTGGHMSRGNSYQSGEAHLVLGLGDLPTAPLYLRGFSGGDYTGGDWSYADDDALLSAAVERLPGWELAWGDPAVIFRDMYFFLNQNAAVEPEPQCHFLQVRNLMGQSGADYAPYYSAKYQDQRNGERLYLFYDQRDMRMDWEGIPDSLSRNWYRRLQDAYLEEAREAYTRVPVERVPRLAALAAENPLTDVDEITAFILHTLHSRAAYSLTPGWTPFGSDIVEEFLFERGKGYCQHFAAAATLLYRLYGVPARYATGFVAEPSDFRRTNREVLSDEASMLPGEYAAILTDRSAHAWVEIFLDGLGWTPVEVTPGSSESAAGENAFASFPGFDRLRFLQIGRMHGWNSVREGTETPDTAGRSDSRSRGTKGGVSAAGVLTALAVLLPTAAALVLYERRRRILEQAERLDCRGAFRRLTELYRFGGVLREPDGEEALTERLPELDPSVPPETAARLAKTVERAAFGPESAAPGPDDDAFVRSVYRDAAGRLYGKLSPFKKAVFKWFRVFG